MRKPQRPPPKSLAKAAPLRPAGRLVWFNVLSEGALAPVEALARRLEHADPDLSVLITAPSVPAEPENGAVIYAHAPQDRRSEIAAFLARWSPDVALWVRGDLRPQMLAELSALHVPLYFLEAGAADINQGKMLWARMRNRTMLRRFDRFLAPDAQAAERLKAQGAQPWLIEITGALEEGAMAPPYNEQDREDLAVALATRPLWFAADLPEVELTVALEAHAAALRRAHRFLLVAAPADLTAAADMAERARALGYRTAIWSETGTIDAEDQILIADLPGEHGLWYRLAPITYLGGTLSGEPCRHPFEPAALGSAVVHGPQFRNHTASFDRLSAAQGSCQLDTPLDLGRALSDLSAPDQSAKLAHAAWDVCSSGAAVTDRVISLIRSALSTVAAS